MIVFPNAKINLGLRVTSRREDGYHNLETLFMPVRQIRDILEIVHAKESKMVTYGTPLDGNPEDNLCMKALRLMQKEYGIGEAEIHLYKKIPVGAGLGGGSADCAFTLSALSTIFELHLSKERLCALAATLGSDCPFFIYNTPMVARGRGELLTPFDENLLPDFGKDYRVEVQYPGIHISTREAYASVVPAEPETAVEDILRRPIEEWKELLVNDFEKSVFPKHPRIAAIKEEMYAKGAVYAAMSGSGSAVYGIFRN